MLDQWIARPLETKTIPQGAQGLPCTRMIYALQGYDHVQASETEVFQKGPDGSWVSELPERIDSRQRYG